MSGPSLEEEEKAVMAEDKASSNLTPTLVLKQTVIDLVRQVDNSSHDSVFGLLVMIYLMIDSIGPLQDLNFDEVKKLLSDQLGLPALKLKLADALKGPKLQKLIGIFVMVASIISVIMSILF